MASEKRAPGRTCIACATQSDKRGFVRFVRDADGVVSVDPTGRQSGRGAYICARMECFDRAWVRRAFARALRVPVNDSDHDRLKREFEALLATDRYHEESDA